MNDAMIKRKRTKRQQWSKNSTQKTRDWATRISQQIMMNSDTPEGETQSNSWLLWNWLIPIVLMFSRLLFIVIHSSLKCSCIYSNYLCRDGMSVGILVCKQYPSRLKLWIRFPPIMRGNHIGADWPWRHLSNVRWAAQTTNILMDNLPAWQVSDVHVGFKT